MIRKPILIVAATLAFASLGPEAKSETPLVFNTASRAPFHDEDGGGFLDVLLAQLGARIGRPIKTVGLPPERAIKDANDGVADGDGHRIGGLGSRYPNLIQVPEAISELRFTAFSKRRDLTVRDWDDLGPLAVAYITGWKIFEANARDAAEITVVRNAGQLFTLVQRDRADVALYVLLAGATFLKANPGFEDIKPIKPPLARVDMFLYIHKKHAALAPRLAEEIRAMKADGSYDALYRQVMGPLLDE